MATQPTLPYSAPEKTLPSTLPTVEDILTSKDCLYSFQGKAALHRVGHHFVVKHGKSTGALLQEGLNMLFVEQSARLLRIPKVYAIFSDEKTKQDFIVMEYISGETLRHDVWLNLTAAQKTNIASQLRRGFDELRSIPSPGYYGGIWRQPIRDPIFQDRDIIGPHKDTAISGPHETEEQWIDAMWLLVKEVSFDPPWGYTLQRIRKDYHVVFKGHKPVFTHADLELRNVILRDDGVVVVIDWEKAGWYPSYWEYCNMRLGEQVWDERISEMLDEYIPHVAWMRQHREC